MSKPPIEGIKLFVLNTSGVNRLETEADIKEYPVRLEVECRLQGVFMDFAAICIYGPTERVVIRGKTLEALQEFNQRNGDFSRHPRLQRVTWTGPDLELVQLPPGSVLEVTS